MELDGRVTRSLRLLAICSYLPASDEGKASQRAALEEACVQPFDAQELWAGIRRHRIFALAQQVLRRNSLTELLGEFEPLLEQQAFLAKIESLRLNAEATHLAKVLGDANIWHRVVKGPPLSTKIYGDAGWRHTNDLDILVGSGDLAEALAALQGDGWEAIRYRGMWPKSMLYRWIAERRLRHFQLFHPRKKMLLELHWRLEHTHTPALDALWRARWSSDGDARVGSGEFLYLCLHGAIHSWIRLKWIGDIQAILDREPGIWAETQDLCRQLALGPVVAQTILVLQQLYQTPVDETARRIVAEHPEAAGLAEFALRSMQFASANIEDSRAATIARRLYLWRVNHRVPYWARFGHFLNVFLVDGLDLEGWNRPAALLPAMPLMQASKLFKRYCLNKQEPVRG